MSRHLFRGIAACAFAVSTMHGVARAEEAAPASDDAGIFSFHGFGTLALTHSDESLGDFNSSFTKPDGVGYTHAWSPDVDSRLGLQLNADFSPRFSAVVQVTSEQRYDDTYKPMLEWANITYAFTPNFSVRVGRIVLPHFWASDFRKVGYANTWVRQPREVYDLLPVTNSDGASFSYRMNVGDFTNTVQGNYGRNDLSVPPTAGSTIEARDLWGVSDTVEIGALTLRAAFQRLHQTNGTVNNFFDLFKAFGPQGVAIANRYDMRDTPYLLTVLGAGYDPGNWFVLSEWARADSNSFLGVNTSWYLGGGIRSGEFTFYSMYADGHHNTAADPGLSLAGLPPPAAGFAAGLNAGLANFLSLGPSSTTTTVGARWDFARNFAAKVQYDRIHIPALTNTQPGYQKYSQIGIFAVTIDFVF